MEQKSNGKGVAVGIAAVAAIALIGGGIWFFTQEDEAEVATTETAQSSQQEQAPAPTQNDIVATAIATEDLSTLVAAVQAAGLVETLQGDGPFTVLAPTNAAFAALPAGTLDSLLLPENKDTLTGILTYHVIAGEVLSSALTNGQVVQTVQGTALTVEITDGKVFFVDAKGGKAEVVAADVDTSNGVVHVINAVLLPS